VRRRRAVAVAALAGLVVALAGCPLRNPFKRKPPGPEIPPGTLTLTVDGRTTELKVESLAVFLVEEEDRYPEIFEMAGTQCALVGAFPLDLHVGYEADFQRMVNRAIEISESGGDPREPKVSYVTLPDRGQVRVVGTLVVEWVEPGEVAYREVRGRVELRAVGQSLDIRGSFRVKTNTWG